jgi:alkanesulfonate monooxygenase SsuD/methylene tetrahydromethanopterin reductase-like flavin-dependent oxidoreductase (luciferase family)
MDMGVMVDGEDRAGQTPQEACDALLALADQAEALDFDSLWLAARHFSPPGGTALIASISAAPRLLATAVARRTRQLQIGPAVLMLP